MGSPDVAVDAVRRAGADAAPVIQSPVLVQYGGERRLLDTQAVVFAAPEEALKKAKVPVIFFHGEQDDFVPSYMSQKCYDVCASRKKLVFIPGAGHGLSFPVDQEGYLSALREFFGPEASL